MKITMVAIKHNNLLKMNVDKTVMKNIFYILLLTGLILTTKVNAQDDFFSVQYSIGFGTPFILSHISVTIIDALILFFGSNASFIELSLV